MSDDRSKLPTTIHAPRSGGRALPTPRWGGIEVVVLTQLLMPGLVFIPGMSWVRTATRVATFLVPLAIWALGYVTGARSFGRPFAAVPWLAACAIWLVVSILHPETNSLLSGIVEAALSIAVMAPAFWVARQGAITPARVQRLVRLIFAANALSALLGIAQFYRPGTFDPPVIPILIQNPESADSRYFEDARGRKILRPCGLSDNPGMAGVAGTTTFVLGLGLTLGRGPWWARMVYLGLSAAGIGIIYLSHVRVTLIIALGGAGCLAGLLLLRREFRRLVVLAALGGAVFTAGLAWALREGGTAVAERFATLLEAKPADVYQRNRGYFLAATFTELLPRRPLGAGMGRWGQPNAYFGRALPPNDPRGPVWVEIQWTGWAVDGGIPLIIAYAGALIVAMRSGLRVVRTTEDRGLADAATMLTAQNIQIVALTLGALPFASAMGVLFWTTAATLDAADQQARARRRAAVLLAAGRARGLGGP